MRLHFLCEKSGAIALVLLGLIAGWQAGSQVVSQSDKIMLNLKFLKLNTRQSIQIFAMFNKCTLLL